MTVTLLDPTGERGAVDRPRATRLPALTDKVVGLLDISKPRGEVFLDRIASRLSERGVAVRRYAKPTFTKPAPPDLKRRISQECDAVIEALAD